MKTICVYLRCNIGTYICRLFRGKTSDIKCKYCRCRRYEKMKTYCIWQIYSMHLYLCLLFRGTCSEVKCSHCKHRRESW